MYVGQNAIPNPEGFFWQAALLPKKKKKSRKKANTISAHFGSIVKAQKGKPWRTLNGKKS